MISKSEFESPCNLLMSNMSSCNLHSTYLIYIRFAVHQKLLLLPHKEPRLRHLTPPILDLISPFWWKIKLASSYPYCDPVSHQDFNRKHFSLNRHNLYEDKSQDPKGLNHLPYHPTTLHSLYYWSLCYREKQISAPSQLASGWVYHSWKLYKV